MCRTADETAEMMIGLRLHALPLWNLADPVRFNFFKSMFYSWHGLGDVSLYYLASSALGALGMPIAERFLFAAGGVVNLLMAAAGGLWCARVLGNRAMGWIFALLVLVSPFYVFISRSGFARVTWIPLLCFLLFLCQCSAMRTRRVGWILAYAALAGFLSMTSDGFFMVVLVPILGILLKPGGFPTRVRALATDRVFLGGFGAFLAGVLVGLVVGVIVRGHGHSLTMMGYLLARDKAVALFPSSSVLAAWARAVDWYFPFRGAWLWLTVVAVWAGMRGFRGDLIGLVATWWILASLYVLRYSAQFEAMSWPVSVLSLNASPLLPPSLLLAAWFFTALAGDELKGVFRRYARERRVVALLILSLLMIFMARQAYALASAENDMDPRVNPGWAFAEVEPRSTACRAVKAAAYYVRSHGGADTYVFHLSGDKYLGHLGEFYYGLSYSRQRTPDIPNHILDFGEWQFKRLFPPEAFYRAYGVERFDFYVDFLDYDFSGDRAWREAVVRRLLSRGARVVCTISDGGRPIARILSFRDEPQTDLDFSDAARRWDHTFARPRVLLQQPLAGTFWYFGPQWREPDTRFGCGLLNVYGMPPGTISTDCRAFPQMPGLS
jgi:hypothetical protein